MLSDTFFIFKYSYSLSSSSNSTQFLTEFCFWLYCSLFNTNSGTSPILFASGLVYFPASVLSFTFISLNPGLISLWYQIIALTQFSICSLTSSCWYNQQMLCAVLAMMTPTRSLPLYLPIYSDTLNIYFLAREFFLADSRCFMPLLRQKSNSGLKMSLERRRMHLRMIPGGNLDWISYFLSMILMMILPSRWLELMVTPLSYQIYCDYCYCWGYFWTQVLSRF